MVCFDCSLSSHYLSQTPAVHWQGSFLVLDHLPTKMPCLPMRLVDCYPSGSGLSRKYRHELQLSRKLTVCLTCARHILETEQSSPSHDPCSHGVDTTGEDQKKEACIINYGESACRLRPEGPHILGVKCVYLTGGQNFIVKMRGNFI